MTESQPPPSLRSRVPIVLAGTAASAGVALATQALWWESAGALTVALLLAEVHRRGQP